MAPTHTLPDQAPVATNPPRSACCCPQGAPASGVAPSADQSSPLAVSPAWAACREIDQSGKPCTVLVHVYGSTDCLQYQVMD